MTRRSIGTGSPREGDRCREVRGGRVAQAACGLLHFAESRLELGEWITYNPLRGEKVLFRTEVRVAYDDRNIYFAFHCFDDEPAKIRTTVSRRDSVFSDDWIALSFDSTGTGRQPPGETS